MLVEPGGAGEAVAFAYCFVQLEAEAGSVERPHPAVAEPLCGAASGQIVEEGYIVGVELADEQIGNGDAEMGGGDEGQGAADHVGGEGLVGGSSHVGDLAALGEPARFLQVGRDDVTEVVDDEVPETLTQFQVLTGGKGDTGVVVEVGQGGLVGRRHRIFQPQ